LCVADVAVKVPQIEVLASGGINDGIKALKCLTLGATSIGSAGAVLKSLHHGGLVGAEQFLDSYLRQLRVGMALTGKLQVSDLVKIPVLISGRLKELLVLKGIDPTLFSKRGE